MKKQLLAITLLVSAVTIQANKDVMHASYHLGHLNKDKDHKDKVFSAVTKLQQTISSLPQTQEQKRAYDACNDAKATASHSDIKDAVVKDAVSKAFTATKKLAKQYKGGSKPSKDLNEKMSTLTAASL